MRQLGLAQLYDLDRLDLTVRTTLDREASARAAKVLSGIANPIYATAAGLTGERLLKAGDLKPVIYSFSLYERTADGNALRVQVDNVDRPLNINEGTKLELGSTAKLRTLVTYLEVIAELHTRYNPQKGRPAPAERSDPISRWAVEYLEKTPDKSLPAMLEAAMNRTYSAHPGERFFTGGGLHQFQNFDSKDNGRLLTVRDAFRRSVNLPFIRLMRDLVDYHMYRTPGTSVSMLMDPNDPARARYLSRFADEEGRKFLGRFYSKYAGQDSDSALALLVQGRSQSLRRLAVIHRSVRPGASLDEFAGFLTGTLPGAKTNVEALHDLYRDYSRERFGLNDRAYLANVHPLELWLLEYLTRRPTATFEEVVNASVAERQEVYRWLLNGKRKRAQDLRIRTLLEADALREIHQRWQRLGYPFASLTPSLATAIGSSADTPAALSELAGIISNGGVRYPPDRIHSLHFAHRTPYETVLGRRGITGETVLPQAVTEQVKQELIGVVEKGTGRRALGSVVRSDGTILAVGGKTGTGDNRVHFYGSKGALIGSSPMNRTAAFVFIIGDRFFGTVVAFVPGNQAAGYHFTSALPVQVFRQLVPAIRPLLES
jgi:membrane peptidoglycan carboxypeptidase